ncbi:siroheme synthase CysG [Sabulicella glaciei]|uniref:Siroheme synthase CysG n=1 Tax=Sabulicella glaciei TaxID=2984948 RepID=A0ABT3NQA6_9PROT|nr:siroheme synthase CysG [Roseococcus sp. MDT2-1-1]MCW8084341.1 siroheme synthase CysG [Roseococcus sp. MDT2-1-1]
MRHFPAFLELQGRDVLLLGEGEALEAKAALLRASGATMRAARRFTPELLDGIALAVGAGAEEEDLVALHGACLARGIPVNVVDRPELCTFITPAIIQREDVTIAVSTGGAAPVLARLVRQRIEAALPPLLGRVAALGARFGAMVRDRLPSLPARRAFLERAFTGVPARLAEAGRQLEAETAFLSMLDRAGTQPAGFVQLVGAGPGAADLLTLRALRALGEADVIVHDRLVPDAVLEMARRDARRIFVGKRRSEHCVPQEGINTLLVELAREGKRVVRLKGGDPFVFGRGGEEAAALREAGIAHEVVPGVTAALGCAAQAGIPLTHRDAARMLTLVTGHTREGVLDLDFRALARPGQTLCVYMGMSTLGALHQGMIWEGYDDATPGMLIERGGTPDQRELRGTLAELVEHGEDWAGDGPVLLILGEAVGMAPLPLVPQSAAKAVVGTPDPV